MIFSAGQHHACGDKDTLLPARHTGLRRRWRRRCTINQAVQICKSSPNGRRNGLAGAWNFTQNSPASHGPVVVELS